jgi:hypothetical protein
LFFIFLKNQTMQQIKTNIRWPFLISVLYLISCNEPATTEKTGNDTAQAVATGDMPSLPAYNPALDPFIVSGANARLLQDTLGIKIFEWWVKPGDPLPLHTHPDHAMYVLQGGKAMVYLKNIPGAEKGFQMEMKAGEGWVGGPVTDSARNIGNTTIKMVEIDVYRPRNK